MGSMLGYWILNGGWRWDFWVITIVALVNFVAFVLLTDETHAQCVADGAMAWTDGSGPLRKFCKIVLRKHWAGSSRTSMLFDA